MLKRSRFNEVDLKQRQFKQNRYLKIKEFLENKPTNLAITVKTRMGGETRGQGAEESRTTPIPQPYA